MLFNPVPPLSDEIFLSEKKLNELAAEYIKGGVLKEKSLADCLHIAYAVVHNCDVIVSWNFKHIKQNKI